MSRGDGERPSAAVLVTGNEILLGLTQDRNSGYLAREFDRLGFSLRRVLTVSDAQDEIVRGLRELVSVDLVVTSGGLGPTHDDRTIAAVAEVADVPLELHEPTLAAINDRTAGFARQRGIPVSSFEAGNRKQSLVPRGAYVLAPVGTAPGVVVALDGGALCAVLPGPPWELERMWHDLAREPRFSRLVERAGALDRQILRVYGTSESAVANAFAESGGDEGGTVTSICARRLEIEVLVRAEPAHRAALDALVAGLRERLGERIYATDDRPLEAYVLEAVGARGWTLAAAESCTAGLVASRIAAIPGASAVLVGGVVSYANEVKRDLLGVSEAVLAAHGAVSAEAAAAMAQGVRRATGADVGVSVTGIAGPEGGSEEKPVGTVFFHLSTPELEHGHHVVMPGGRGDVRDWAATTALHLVRMHVAAPA
jgi:nicotinamide-nucleotide amidase